MGELTFDGMSDPFPPGHDHPVTTHMHAETNPIFHEDFQLPSAFNRTGPDIMLDNLGLLNFDRPPSRPMANLPGTNSVT